MAYGLFEMGGARFNAMNAVEEMDESGLGIDDHGSLKKSLVIDLAADYVFFVQNPVDAGLVILLPVLPPRMDLDSYGYAEFLGAFHRMICGNAIDDDGFVGVVRIEHAFATYQFVVLAPLEQAALDAGVVTVIPYCATEGFREDPMAGADIPVSRG